MSVTYLLQQVINGLVLGSQYALFAAGLTLIFGVLRIMNVAHGAVLMWGGMTAFVLVTKTGLPLPFAVLGGGIASGAISVLIDRIAFVRLRNRPTNTFVDSLAPFVASIGSMMLLVNAAQHIFGSSAWRFPSRYLPSGVFTVSGVFVTRSQVYILIPSLLIVIGLHVLIAFSKIGKAIRAVAYDGTIARLLGIPVESIIVRSFLLAGLVAGIAGSLTGIAFSVGPYMAHDVLLKGFAAIVLGGLGSLGGSLVGGMTIGVSEVLAVTLLSSDFKDFTAFLILFLVLLVRPHGLFGKREDVRA